MVIGYHIVLSAYGFWLPNEERGSWSKYVGATHLLPFGRATFVATHRSLAKNKYDRELRREMRAALKYPAVRFTGVQAKAIASGIGETSHVTKCPIFAFAILPDHAHLVVPRHRYPVEQLIDQLKARATSELKKLGIHPFQHIVRANGQLPKMWARGAWTVFLEDDEDIRRSIRYTNDNPTEMGLKTQKWSFVVPFESYR